MRVMYIIKILNMNYGYNNVGGSAIISLATYKWISEKNFFFFKTKYNYSKNQFSEFQSPLSGVVINNYILG